MTAKTAAQSVTNPSLNVDRSSILQRKCDCGKSSGLSGQCSDCEAKKLLQRRSNDSTEITEVPPIVHEVLRSPGEPLDRETRTFMESRFGHDFSQVKVHTDQQAANSAQAVKALAYTVGEDVVFASGQYAPKTTAGKRLLAHELTHVVQQSGDRTRLMPVSLFNPPNDRHEQEADTVADAVVAGQSIDRLPISTGVDQAQRDFIDDVVDTGSALLDEADAAIDAAEDTVMGIARAVWEEGQALANALGGSVSISGGRLVIDVPALSVCPNVAIEFSLPEIGKDLPFFEAILPIGEVVFLYGSVGLHVGLVPTISGELGPCLLEGLRIVIDPLSDIYSAQGSLTVNTAMALAGELSVGIQGEVGAGIVWPDPPIVLEIPVVTLGAGLAGFARGTIASVTTIGGSIGYAGGSFSLSAFRDQTQGFAIDLGIAGYGELDLLGMNLCRMYWPLWDWHEDVTVSSSMDVSLDIDSDGAFAQIELSEPAIDEIPFEELPFDLQRNMFADDCPLCDTFYELGLMPSQRGSSAYQFPNALSPWGYPTRIYPPASGETPPPYIYSQDPRITDEFPGESLCRGACGYDCAGCDEPLAEDVSACVDTGDGHHQLWVYKGVRICPTHEGCREHDAGYDWCAADGEVSAVGPCHRLPDFEAVCQHGVPNSVSWAFGGPPRDDVIWFAEDREYKGSCVGACPEETAGGEGEATTYQVCIPDVMLFDRTEFMDGFDSSTGIIPLYTFELPAPYDLGIIFINIFTGGSMRARVGAGLGPAWLSDVCLNVDPASGSYSGTAEFHLSTDLMGELGLTGMVGVTADWNCLVEVAKFEGGLTGTGRAILSTELVDRVQISCQNGELAIDNSVSFEPCLNLNFDLDAFLNVSLFTFPVLTERWNLVSHQWENCWPIDLGISAALSDAGAMPGLLTPSTPLLSGAAAPGLPTPLTSVAPMLSVQSIDPNTLFPSLFGAATDNQLTPALPADPAAASGSTNPCGTEEETIVNLLLPPQKATHLSRYRGLIGELQHSIDREERDTEQIDKWEENIGAEMTRETRCHGVSLGLNNNEILRPNWSRTRFYRTAMGVDHVVEWQVRPIEGGRWIDEPWNFELLDPSSNSSSGPRLSGNIRRERRELARTTGDPSWETRDLTFTQVTAEAGSPADRWSSEDIVDGEHFVAYERLEGVERDEERFQDCVDRGR